MALTDAKKMLRCACRSLVDSALHSPLDSLTPPIGGGLKNTRRYLAFINRSTYG